MSSCKTKNNANIYWLIYTWTRKHINIVICKKKKKKCKEVWQCAATAFLLKDRIHWLKFLLSEWASAGVGQLAHHCEWILGRCGGLTSFLWPGPRRYFGSVRQMSNLRATVSLSRAGGLLGWSAQKQKRRRSNHTSVTALLVKCPV